MAFPPLLRNLAQFLGIKIAFRKGMISLLNSFLTYLLCFQLAVFQVALSDGFYPHSGRFPAQTQTQVDLPELKKGIDRFKVSILGQEYDHYCKGEQSLFVNREDGKNSFYPYLKSLKENACSQQAYIQKVAQEKKCTPQKINGFLDREVTRIMRLEEKGEEIAPFSLDHPTLMRLQRKAQALLAQLQGILVNEKVSSKKRFEILLHYLGNVVMPMRDLIVIMRSYAPRERGGASLYEDLIPSVPLSLIPENDLEKRDQVELGPDPSRNPFYFKVSYDHGSWIELSFKRDQVLARDILNLLKAPTKKNYVRAMKWMTLHLMLQQAFIYSSMLNDQSPIKIPRACQNHFNGDLPAQFDFQYQSEKGQEFIDNLLTSKGFIFDEGDYQFMDYYMDNVNRDPTREGYSGLTPFEEHKAASAGLKKARSSSLRIDIDDYSYFDKIINLKMNQVMQAFEGKSKGEVEVIEGHLLGRRAVLYRSATLMEQILELPQEGVFYSIPLENGEEVEIDPVFQNLSVYLAEVMQRNGVTHFEDLITGELKERLQSTTLRIPFPSLYGSTYWRQWALNQLREWAENKGERETHLSSSIKMVLSRACTQAPRDNTICPQDKNSAKLLNNLKTYLRETIVSDEYIPTQVLERQKDRANYHFLGILWKYLRDFSQEIPEARTNEYDYLVQQMNGGNPWARLRLSYLIADEELRAFENNEKPAFKSHRRFSMQYLDDLKERQCFSNNLSVLRERLKKGAQKLNLDHPLRPHHGNRLLSQREKKYLWNEVVSQSNELFSELDFRDQNEEYYRKLEKVTYQTFLTKEKVEEFSKEHPNLISPQAREEIDEIFEQPFAQYGSFFYELYELRGQPKEQAEVFQRFTEEHGMDNKFMVKMNFLGVDNRVKKPILRSLLREAALARRGNIINQLNTFCEMEADDHDSLKALFYATSKAQNKLNELAGYSAVPEETLEKIKKSLDSLSPTEKGNIWLGVGAGALIVGVALLGGACTAFTGGLCGIAMGAAATGSLGLQATLIKREIQLKMHSKIHTRQVKEMERLGFADSKSSSEVKRTWFWTALEILFTVPFVGITARSLSAGAKASYLFGVEMLRKSGKIGFKEAFRVSKESGKTLFSQEEIILSRLVLGLDSSSLSKSMTKKSTSKIKQIQQSYLRGNISYSSMLERVGAIVGPFRRKPVVSESFNTINSHTAKTVARYFNDNPKSFALLMGSYNKRLKKAKRLMDKGAQSARKSPLHWFRKFRFGHLVEHSEKVGRIHRELMALTKRDGNLESYILKNVDDLTDIFVNILTRKREFPYLFTLMGGPHMGGFWKGSRVGYISSLADGVILRKFFNARSRLIYESAKAQARQTLGLSQSLSSENLLQHLRAFQKSIEGAIVKSSSRQGEKLLIEYTQMQDQLANTVLKNIDQGLLGKKSMSQIKRVFSQNQGKQLEGLSQLDAKSLKKVLFSPHNNFEKALGDALWESVDMDQFLGVKKLADLAHRIVQKLSRYNNVDEFENYLNALKILIIKKNPGAVEII